MTKNTIIIFMLILACLPNYGQANKADKLAITTLIQMLFDGMRNNDSTNLRSLFTENATIETVVSENNVPFKDSEKAGVFIEAIGKPRIQTWEERTEDYNLTVSYNYAILVANYTFYLDDSLHHCGINKFELLKISGNWKIDNITDTRQTEGCVDIPSNSIVELEKIKHDTLSVNAFLDSWHKAAAKADEDVFFNSIAENGIYIGTDATECWNKQEFYNWAIKYFQRESAWDFTPISRNIYFSTDGETVWFNELLNTWMGVCRGSGTIHPGNQGWKIDQYHLSVTVPNARIKDFIELLK